MTSLHKPGPLWIFAALATLFAGLGVLIYLALPTRLTVAVGPRDSGDFRVVRELARVFSLERRSIRLKVLVTDGAEANAAALQARRADLAIIRADVALPKNGQTIAIMHRNAALIISRKGIKASSVAGLRDKRVAILRGNSANVRMFDAILAHYGVPVDSVERVFASQTEVATLISENKVDFVFVVGHQTAPQVIDVVHAVTTAGGGTPGFIAVPDAEAIAQRLPVYESIEILRGIFGGTPPVPDDALNTLAVSYRLMAHSSLPETTASQLLRLMLTVRQNIAAVEPLAARIEAPDDDVDQAIPVHSGALAFVNSDEKTFFDLYGDWLYLGVMALSLLGSAGALFLGAFSGRQVDPHRARMRRALEILSQAHSAEDEAAINVLRGELGLIVAESLVDSRAGNDDDRLSAIALAISSARAALAERKAHLREAPAEIGSVHPII